MKNLFDDFLRELNERQSGIRGGPGRRDSAPRDPGDSDTEPEQERDEDAARTTDDEATVRPADASGGRGGGSRSARRRGAR